MITINLNKAKDITKDRLRVEREPKLKELDISYQRADETGNTELKMEIASQKQALRDITLLVNDCETTEELKLIKVE
jgi:hypothetical protein